MNYMIQEGQMTLSDRIAIETGLCGKESFRQIAKLLHRHPSTISHEVKQNRTYIPGSYLATKDCKFVRTFHEHHMCGNLDCQSNCCKCLQFKCTEVCKKYVSVACHKYDSPPYVCNACEQKRLCTKARYLYSAKHADAAVNRRRSESRQGIHLSEENMEEMDRLVTSLVNKGQPLTHIYAAHGDELPVCLRTLYNYINDGEMTIRNIDLRRKTSYRPRKKPLLKNAAFASMEFRKGRTYTDFELAMKTKYSESDVVEMDTVKGARESGKRLLTLIFRSTNLMLLFLMPDGKAESVKRVFDYLESGLGIATFKRLFPLVLTDNGSEFKKVDWLEQSEENGIRTQIFYCDPMASWQKGCIEKNHEYIRYAIPKGKSFNPYTQNDITLLMNHMNSVKRTGLGNKSPYDLIDDDDTDMQRLMLLLKMHPVQADEVHLTSDLFSKK